ncbi:endonuclease [bacterium]|nr:endonuclease [bacterium]
MEDLDSSESFILEDLELSQNLGQKSFTKAKNFLKNDIYPSYQIGIYCGCTYDKQLVVKDYQEERAKSLERYKVYHWDSEEGFEYISEEDFKKKTPTYKLVPNHETCGFVPKGNGTRAAQMEWEHVVPASLFGHTFPEWKNGHEQCVSTPRETRRCKRVNLVTTESVSSEPNCSTDPITGVQTCIQDDISCTSYMSEAKEYNGRRCLTKVSEEYALMQADMHNLFPAIGEVNGYRSNYPMAEITGEAREFGKCDAEIQNKQFEPRNEVRGDIARTHFYMQDAYSNHLDYSDEMADMLKNWDQLDPVDNWECDRNKKIEAIQGNDNGFVSKACKKLLRSNSKRKGIFQTLFDLFK